MDLGVTGDTWKTAYGFDSLLPTYLGTGGADLYIQGHDLTDPYISPLFGDFSKGFPPTFIQSGTRDRLHSDAVRLHRALLKASVIAELHVWEGMPHGGFGGAPQDLETRASFATFMNAHVAA